MRHVSASVHPISSVCLLDGSQGDEQFIKSYSSRWLRPSDWQISQCPMSRVLTTWVCLGETYMARAVEVEPSPYDAGRDLLVKLVCPSHDDRRLRQERELS
jgi:hypothetical protein